ncbi:MAG: hypothetical protein MHM6MM_005490 [Cercozoa sp. M6MM]
MNQLEQLKQFSTVVADSGEFATLAQFGAEDATTNPSLILKAAQIDEYRPLIEEAVEYAKSKDAENPLSHAMDKVSVNFGLKILEIVPGVVSTEIDARLSFDKDACVKKALEIIALYEQAGIPRERVLIKIASTWEGIQAARELQSKHNVRCNLTLMFCLAQAAAAAEAGATLISPFVGRITDFHKQKQGVDAFEPESDPGVLSVRAIYAYYKKYGYDTVVMGASFRSKEQVLALAGCDKLTVAPKLLTAMSQCNDSVEQKLSPSAEVEVPEKLDSSESAFRWAVNADPCAVEKLSDGIRRFAADTEKLEKLLSDML